MHITFTYEEKEKKTLKQYPTQYDTQNTHT